jgi:serine-type D-Ala-D-Ala carboxypeptidase
MKPEANAGPTLADETAAQERRFARAFQLLRQGVTERVFPGAALVVAHRGRLLAWEAFGRFTYEMSSPEVRPDTVWDLASLTKPIVTASMAMLLYERGRLSLDAPISDCLRAFAEGDLVQEPTWRRRVTCAMLLAHSSGLPAHRKLYLASAGREAIQRAALRLPLEAEPGTRAEYSDMGFLVLGELLERLAGERIDSFCQREVFTPLNLNFTFVPQPSQQESIPPTVDDRVYRRKIVQGEVNDENAWAMGGVAAHAGLFGDALSVARFAECILRGGKSANTTTLFRPETVALFTARQAEPPGTSRTLGWDTPSTPSQSGTLFSPRSFGHLGYTGTSLWCDPERQLSVTLLTNRTWPDSKNQAIKELRPRVHDAIVEALGE